MKEQMISTSQRIPEKLLADIDAIAEEEAKSRNEIVIDALKLYRDATYMHDKASIIPKDILNAMESIADRMEQRVNQKTNQVLSSLAIQVMVLQQVVARSLSVDKTLLEDYTVNAVSFIRQNNRCFRLGDDVKLTEPF